MSRVEKKTRIKGLPAKIQLQTIDAHTGSHPAVVRMASDNRTGQYNVHFDDTTPVVFASGSMNAGASVTADMLSSDGYQTLGQDMSSSLTIPGNVVKSLVDKNLLFNTPGQALEPFKDHSNPAVDGKSNGNEFYATGSKVDDVGEGFDSPLWSKSKIEIDITPGETHSFNMTNFISGASYPMAYWNKDSKTFEGVGPGTELQHYIPYTASFNSTQRVLEEQHIGFSNGMQRRQDVTADAPWYEKSVLGFGEPINTFGFPFAAKYHATSSNTIELSEYINQPFLAEKMVLEFSGTLTTGETFISGADLGGGGTLPVGAGFSITNFFVLSQRKNARFNKTIVTTVENRVDPLSPSYTYLTGSTIWQMPGTSSVDGMLTTTTRDLISSMQITAISGGQDATVDNVELTGLLTRDFNAVSGAQQPGLEHGEWSGHYIMSSSLRYPKNLPGFGKYIFGSSSILHFDAFDVGYDGYGRNTAVLDVKSFRNTFKEPESEITPSLLAPITAPSDGNYGETNPCLLLPEDGLIIGWQLPIQMLIAGLYDGWGAPFDLGNVGEGEGSKLEFAPVPSKLTIYGSYIKEGKEHHDTLNQLLTNNNVYEVIGDD